MDDVFTALLKSCVTLHGVVFFFNPALFPVFHQREVLDRAVAQPNPQSPNEVMLNVHLGPANLIGRA